MSAKKSKRRKHPKSPQLFEKLQKRIEAGPFKDMELRPGPAEAEKMSFVLGRFVEPYIEHADTEEAYRKLLTLAVIAWNASLSSEEEGQILIDQLIEEGLPKGETELKADARAIIDQMVARKRDFFPEYRREIIEFEVVDLGDRYHLAVASTLGDVG